MLNIHLGVNAEKIDKDNPKTLGQHWSHKTQDKDNPKTLGQHWSHKTRDKDNPETLGQH